MNCGRWKPAKVKASVVDRDTVMEEEELNWESTGFFCKVFSSVLMCLNDTLHDLKLLNAVAQRVSPHAHKFIITDAGISKQNADCARAS